MEPVSPMKDFKGLRSENVALFCTIIEAAWYTCSTE